MCCEYHFRVYIDRVVMATHRQFDHTGFSISCDNGAIIFPHISRYWGREVVEL